MCVRADDAIITTLEIIYEDSYEPEALGIIRILSKQSLCSPSTFLTLFFHRSQS